MSILPWIGFIVLVLLLLALDLGVLNRRPATVTTAKALRATAIWVTLALAFNVCVYFMYEYQLFGIGTRFGQSQTGSQAALQFFTAYVVEESLSVDNLFVMAMIFRYFAVPSAYQHRVLFLGILGALVFRGIFIGAGLAFIHHFAWAIYVFGGLLVATALKMLFSKEDSLKPDKHPLVRVVRHFYPMTTEYHGDRFFVRLSGKLTATPLLLALVLVEGSDIVFAVDSVPAVFGVTRDAFIAFTSNVFAMLGLRSLYFVLAAAMNSFRYLKASLVVILGFVGLKMLLTDVAHIDSWISLVFIAAALAVGVLASLLFPGTPTEDAHARASMWPESEPSEPGEQAGPRTPTEPVRPSGSD
ncbi:MAG TPA: TerC/Alx family metal homeostasis membrane protein [Polyangiales bacterium]|nr:TerC/Alx family metal homeostasis membrane protein [Polyangiales bacterium]